ncbi:bifunctional class I SAM-dependent methyltransferase/glycosyltransferase family 2 protein [Telluribacter humicola]|uniref:bifunctional class I SAM-dependent methyltransferase/glycosyltransferase family 2 protein n=1 Tax=Telluribacter humicola TaxID=1720261 RepID=UPI001A964E5E|nr:bifunctional class I SAM-dependent methyltransferase/glycosyltransferase family 2 protein [Telluribacter humicola]
METVLFQIDTDENKALAKVLGLREEFRDNYWKHKDPILWHRLQWRAQTFRHMVHLLPGQTILELGCGEGLFTQHLYEVSRGENPITAVSFTDQERPDDLPDDVEFINGSSLLGYLRGQQFDYIVSMDLLDQRNCAWLLRNMYDYLLKPGGQVLFFESNPWNVVLQMRRLMKEALRYKDPRKLLNRSELYELISEIGFIRVFAVCNDFVYAPFSRRMIWLLRNLSILLENMPVIKTLAGSILIHAQKPPKPIELPLASLCEHESLRSAVSVVIPCHNEEMNVEPLVRRLKGLYNDYIHEIILVDDNSRDLTATVIQRLANEDPRIKPVIRKPPNGVGRAITDGFKAATGQYILSMDCDFQHLLPEIRDMFDVAAEGHDVIIGSRFSRHSVLLNYPFQKILANRGFHLLANILLRRRFRDVTNNLKLIRREVVEKMELTQPGFSINAETGLQPYLMGYSIIEVPISWINRTPDMGVSSFKLVKVGGGYWQVLWKMWKKKGAYRKRKESGSTRAVDTGSN